MENAQENVLSISDKIALKEVPLDWRKAISNIVNPNESLIFYRKKFLRKILRFFEYIVLGFGLAYCFLALYAIEGTFTPVKGFIIYATPSFYSYFGLLLMIAGFFHIWTRFFVLENSTKAGLITGFVIYLFFIFFICFINYKCF